MTQDTSTDFKMAESSTDLELYTCNSCTFTIPTHLARVTCHQCPNHHLCANCHVIKAFVSPHTNSHSAMVFKQSGIVVPLPPGFAPRPPPALPPRPRSTLDEDPKQSSKSSEKGKGKEPELGAANWSALWSIMKAPLEKKGKKSRTGSTDADENADILEPKDVTGSGLPDDSEVVSGEKDLPPSPPRSVRRSIERVDSQAAITPSYPQPDKWEALFEADLTPTPIFVALMSTIFSHLDPEHIGFLRPETYSQFLETQGCVESNVCMYSACSTEMRTQS